LEISTDGLVHCQATFEFDSNLHGPLTYVLIPKRGMPRFELKFDR
jgi:hypothetical protein